MLIAYTVTKNNLFNPSVIKSRIVHLFQSSLIIIRRVCLKIELKAGAAWRLLRRCMNDCWIPVQAQISFFGSQHKTFHSTLEYWSASDTSETRHWLLVHELFHQWCECPIRIHELSLRTDKVICALGHTAKERVFKHVGTLVHPICHLSSKCKDFLLISRNRRNLRYHDRVLWEFLMPKSVND